MGWTTSPRWKELRELDLFILEFKAHAITIFHCLKSCYKEDGGSLFIRRYMEKTRGSGYKLHWERFCPVIEMFYSENYQFGTASSWA